MWVRTPGFRPWERVEHMAVFVIGVIDSIQDEAGFIAYQQKAGADAGSFRRPGDRRRQQYRGRRWRFFPGRHGGHSVRNNGQRQSLVQRSGLQQRQTRSFQVRHQQHDLPATRITPPVPPLNLLRLGPRWANGPATSSSFPGWIRRYFPRTFTPRLFFRSGSRTAVPFPVFSPHPSLPPSFPLRFMR